MDRQVAVEAPVFGEGDEGGGGGRAGGLVHRGVSSERDGEEGEKRKGNKRKIMSKRTRKMGGCGSAWIEQEGAIHFCPRNTRKTQNRVWLRCFPCVPWANQFAGMSRSGFIPDGGRRAVGHKARPTGIHIHVP